MVFLSGASALGRVTSAFVERTRESLEILGCADFKERIALSIKRSRAKIAASPMATSPYPHLVIDNLLPRTVLRALNQSWPDSAIFEDEVPGNHCASDPRRDEAQQHFWMPFYDCWNAIMKACAERFAPITSVTMPGLTPEPPKLMLMQADDRYDGHGTHMHFYHNPNWILTALFYADHEDMLSHGTNLVGIVGHPWSYNPGEVDFMSEIALRTMRWDAMGAEIEHIEVPYRANRLLVLLDGPMGLHAVTPGKPGRRRILRTHLMTNWDEFSRNSMLAGMDHSTYFAKNGPAEFYETFMRERMAKYAHACSLITDSATHR